MAPEFPPPAPKFQWASYIEDRSPKYKYHKNRGQAYNAVMYEGYGHPRGGVIYHEVHGDWIVDFEYQQDMNCVICGEPTQDGTSGGQASKVDYRAPREDTQLVHWRCKYPERYPNG